MVCTSTAVVSPEDFNDYQYQQLVRSIGIMMVKVVSRSNVDHALLHELRNKKEYIQAYKK